MDAESNATSFYPPCVAVAEGRVLCFLVRALRSQYVYSPCCGGSRSPLVRRIWSRTLLMVLLLQPVTQLMNL